MHRYWLHAAAPVWEIRLSVKQTSASKTSFKDHTNKTFGRPHQREIIEAALEGHDIYVQAATSFGKSLCFQLPAVIDTGST